MLTKMASSGCCHHDLTMILPSYLGNWSWNWGSPLLGTDTSMIVHWFTVSILQTIPFCSQTNTTAGDRPWKPRWEADMIDRGWCLGLVTGYYTTFLSTISSQQSRGNFWQVSIRMHQPLLVISFGMSPQKVVYIYIWLSEWHLPNETGVWTFKDHHLPVTSPWLRLHDSSWLRPSELSFQLGQWFFLRPIQWLWCYLPNIKYPQYGPSTETSQCFQGAN